IKSVYELIIILNDVVKALGALAGCNILHRDISDSNIMFTRDKDGNVCGVLIDLDNAVDAERAQIDKRPICTGTLPFMSVNNLEQSDAARKNVDELESMLYLLIWMGVWGAASAHRASTARGTRKVSDWNDPKRAAEAKRDKMNSASNLGTLLREFFRVRVPKPNGINGKEIEIAEWINESYVILEELVLDLRACLFDNPNLPPWARSTQPGKPERLGFKESGSDQRANDPSNDSATTPNAEFDDPTVHDGLVDPFRERTKDPAADVLFASFARILAKYGSIAQSKITEAKAKGGALVDSGNVV
ncbi:hypothetical protein LPJ61_006978, partial [Coemansia biformis]